MSGYLFYLEEESTTTLSFPTPSDDLYLPIALVSLTLINKNERVILVHAPPTVFLTSL